MTKKKMGKSQSRKRIVCRSLAVILTIAAVVMSVLGRLLTVSLMWMRDWWGPVDFSTALFQLKTPLVGVNNNVIEIYIRFIALPAVKFLAAAVVLLLLIRYLIKVTGYTFKFFIKDRLILRFGSKTIFTAGLIALLLYCWIPLFGVAKQTGVPEYIDSLIHRSTVYEDYYVEPAKDILVFPENKRNLVLIYAESMESSFASVEDGGHMTSSLIPELTGLALDNVNFSDKSGFGGGMQSQNTGWTMAALLASSSGVTFNLPVDGNDMEDYATFLPGLTALGDILSQEGYSNYFACGSEAFFGGRKAYFRTHGDYTIHDYNYALEEGFLPEGYHNGFWGMEDEKLFDMVKVTLTKAASTGDPFNYTILTSDTHAPDGYICDLCDPVEGEDLINTAIRCSDRQIAMFVEWMSSQSWYDNTTVVILGDHLIMTSLTDLQSVPADDQRVYNCYINVSSDLPTSCIQNRSFTAADHFPTILAAMGVRIEGDRLGLGTNLFSGSPTLPEQIGLEEYNTEVLRYSEYYSNHFT